MPTRRRVRPSSAGASPEALPFPPFPPEHGVDLQVASQAAIQTAVQGWFATAQRALPWRRNYDPYGVWVAEIMLQQTQVETVRPYYERWLARFPDVRSVAAAPQQDVLKAWEGLGYYSRARNLQRAAQAIVERHGGRLPDTVAALLALPGIGRYTAGAIVSIGYDRPAPLVDGNVGRVLGRLVALDVPARSATGQRRLWALAAALVPQRNPRDFNQGLMELGALLCRPQAPQCLLCPLREHCAACAQGRPEAYPPPPVRRARPLRRGALLLLRDDAGRVLLRRRPPEGIWGGLWEPPWSERAPGESAAAAARRLLAELGLAELDLLGAGRLRPAGLLTHGLTHFALELRCYRGQVAADAASASTQARPDGEDARCWADAARIAALPLARLGHKALRLAEPAAKPAAPRTVPPRR